MFNLSHSKTFIYRIPSELLQPCAENRFCCTALFFIFSHLLWLLPFDDGGEEWRLSPSSYGIFTNAETIACILELQNKVRIIHDTRKAL